MVAQPVALTLGTDCSGIDAVAAALSRLGITPEYEFASDIDPCCRRLMETSPHPRPKVISPDACARKEHPPTVDLYVAGPPCQSFSGLGFKRGLNDDRTSVLCTVLDYIATRQPTVFVIENVKALLSNDDGESWAELRRTLDGIAGDDGEPAYQMDWEVLSPHQMGWPQSRQRLFIVGRHRGKLGKDAATPFPWLGTSNHPDPPVALQDLLQPNEQALEEDAFSFHPVTPKGTACLDIVRDRLLQKGIDYSATRPQICDPHVSRGRLRLPQDGVCLCLTTRSQQLFVLGRERYITPRDALALMGFRPEQDFAAPTLAAIPRRHIFRLAGNSMVVPLMARILAPLVEMLTRTKTATPRGL